MPQGTLLTPLSIVLAFIGVIEATLAYRVTALAGTAQMIFVWFMVTFPALVLAGFFYIQISAPLSWYPPSELDRTSIERLQFLDYSATRLISFELLDKASKSGSKTIGEKSSPATEAVNLYERGEYEQALQLFRAAVAEKATSQSGSGVSSSAIAAAQVNLGTTLSSLGRLDEAANAFERALTIYSQIGDEPSTAIALNNLGSVYKSRGDYGRALATYEKSLEISRKVFGTEHPDSATTMNNLATVYAAMGDLARAQDLFQRSLATTEKVFGSNHPRTATALSNLASVYASMGELDRALELYQRALGVLTSGLGPDHPTTEAVRRNIEQLGGKNVDR